MGNRLKTYNGVSRFMGGPAVTPESPLIYLKEAGGVERVGRALFDTLRSGRPIFRLQDTLSEQTFEYKGESFMKRDNPQDSFIWFPTIKEAGILHNPSGTAKYSAGQTRNSLLHNFPQFIACELAYERVNLQGGVPPESSIQQEVLRMEKAAEIYAYSLSIMYALLNSNYGLNSIMEPSARDFEAIEARGKYGVPEDSQDKPQPAIDLPDRLSVSIIPTFSKFLEDPGVIEQFTTLTVSENGTSLATKDKLLARLRRDIPDEVLEAMYRQFIAEVDGGERLQALRIEHPQAELEAKVTEMFDTAHAH